MPHLQVRPFGMAEAVQLRVAEAVQALHEHMRLTAMVRTMAREIERLTEANRQLREAIGVYRHVARCKPA